MRNGVNKRISQKAEYANKALIKEENLNKQLLAQKPNIEEVKKKQSQLNIIDIQYGQGWLAISFIG